MQKSAELHGIPEKILHGIPEEIPVLQRKEFKKS
jgi:hypothetical protein